MGDTSAAAPALLPAIGYVLIVFVNDQQHTSSTLRSQVLNYCAAQQVQLCDLLV